MTTSLTLSRPYCQPVTAMLQSDGYCVLQCGRNRIVLDADQLDQLGRWASGRPYIQCWQNGLRATQTDE